MLTQKEILRQVFHLMLGIILALGFYLDIISPLAMFLGIIIGGLASLIYKRFPLPVFNWCLKKLEREEACKTFPGRGMIFYFVGVLLVMQLFPKDIALAAIMVLACGDSVSHVIGERFGHIHNIFNGKGKKLFEGTIAGTVAGLIGAVFFVPFTEALIGSFIAMIAEVIEFDLNGKPLDDNLIVPLVAGTIIYILRMAMGI